MSVQSANIHFNQHGTPVASDFDDVYFSNTSGIEESEYVFVNNNHLLERWQQWSGHHFVIAETGFGTGLNFLVTMQRFNQFRRDNPQHPLQRLYFISIEKFPISQATLTSALAAWPQLEQLSKALLQQYPHPIQGCHRMQFSPAQVYVDLHIGDVNEVLPNIPAKDDGLIDAWFLDGFAPSKNPQMWSQSLFHNMARLSRQQTTFATFTAAGVVKRGLREVGFLVEKRPGFGRKRDMLAGHLHTKTQNPQSGLFHRHHFSKPQHIAIVGAGLAGASCALALAKRGYQVKLYYQEKQIAGGASGNVQGGFYPHLNATVGIASQIHALAFQFASNHYLQLLNQGHHFAHQWCGVLLPGFSQEVVNRQQKLITNNEWPAELIRGLDSAEATAIAGLSMPYSGLYIPDGGWINPRELVAATLAAAQQTGNVSLYPQHSLRDATLRQDGCQLQWQNGQTSEADAIIFACGHHTQQLSHLAELPLRQVRGQVEQIRSVAALSQLNTVLCHKGYLTPAQHGTHALGSSYVKQDQACEYRHSEAQHNLRTLQQALPKCDWTQQVQLSGGGRAAVRCGTPDHLPVVGAVPHFQNQKQQYAQLYKGLAYQCWPNAENQPNAYLLTGLGSRGLTTAPLLAEVLACQISGEPLPLHQPLLAALNPNRFLIRQLVRNQSATAR